jgi:Lar family restriction alleviation protein
MNKLLPCPFCGGEAETFEASEDSFSILCTGCGVETPYLPYLTEAIAAWNRRVILDGCENELIVRCKDCKHYNTIGCSKGFGWCENIDRGTSDNFYCANGAKMEDNR